MSSYLTFYYTIWVKETLLVTNVNYIRTKKFVRRFLCLMIKIILHFYQAFFDSLSREMVISCLKHQGVLLVLLLIMKVLVETDEETEW